MATQQVTILIPNYKTYELTKLCLRLLRKYTDPALAKVIVIDNNSRDESTTYLRNLKWITLLERPGIPNESPALSHSRALDDALPMVDTPFVLSIHTDTLMRNAQWLPFLLEQITRDPNIAGVGSWKLAYSPLPKRLAKTIEGALQRIYYQAIGKKSHTLEGIGDNHYYLRSHCALYRMELINKYQLSFSDENEVAGKVMHRKLVEHGHKMIFLPSEVLIRYLDHINHATMILHPELGIKQKGIDKGLRRIQKNLEQFKADEILADDSLDR